MLAGYDRLDIASVEHPAEDYVAAMAAPVKGLRVGVARAPFFDHLDADVATATEAALKVIASLTRSLADVVLPTTRDVNLNGEMYAWHEPLFAQMASRYQIPTRRNLQNGNAAKAADYIRGRWALERLRRTIDDSFMDVDVVVLPTRRHTPRTVDAALQREETDVPRNPELENTGAVQRLRHPGDLGAVRLHLGRPAGGPDDCRPALRGRPRAGPGPRLRAGHRVAHQAAADCPGHGGAAAGKNDPVADQGPGRPGTGRSLSSDLDARSRQPRGGTPRDKCFTRSLVPGPRSA